MTPSPSIAADADFAKLAARFRDFEDPLRELFTWFLHQLIDWEFSTRLGAEPYERTPSRSGLRNGTRTRRFQSRLGTLLLTVPRPRHGGYLPFFLQDRQRSDEALIAVILEAYVHGVSTRKMADVLEGLGVEGVSRSQVSRLCGALDERVQAFRERPLEGPFPVVWLDAVYEKIRCDRRVLSQAVVVATAVDGAGKRQVLGFAVGPTESGDFWKAFLRSLVERGLAGVSLVVSDAHAGLREAIGAVLTGAAWQRCQVHWMRNVLGHVPHHAKKEVAEALRRIFWEPRFDGAQRELQAVADRFDKRFPKAARVILDGEDDVLTHLHFPQLDGTRIRSTNGLERLNREIRRRTRVVGTFPSEAAAVRLIGALLLEQHEAWQEAPAYLAAAKLREAGSAPPLPATGDSGDAR